MVFKLNFEFVVAGFQFGNVRACIDLICEYMSTNVKIDVLVANNVWSIPHSARTNIRATIPVIY